MFCRKYHNNLLFLVETLTESLGEDSRDGEVDVAVVISQFLYAGLSGEAHGHHVCHIALINT